MHEESLPVGESESEQSLLAALLQRSRLYYTSQSYRDLLDFVIRQPHLAPFNGMLLNIQKPGLRFAASMADWKDRFNRTVREGARPLVILWPFAPVAFVFDVADTQGDPLPADVAHAFRATGPITPVAMTSFEHRLWKFGIYVAFLEYGDGHAGHIGADGVVMERRSLEPKSAHLTAFASTPGTIQTYNSQRSLTSWDIFSWVTWGLTSTFESQIDLSFLIASGKLKRNHFHT